MFTWLSSPSNVANFGWHVVNALEGEGHRSTLHCDRLAGNHRFHPDNVLHGSGVHAAAFTALVRASRRLDAWLGGAVEGEDSFPLTDGDDLAANRIFFAALTSRS